MNAKENAILLNQIALMELLIRMADAFPHEQKVLKERIAISKQVIKNSI